MEPWTLTARWIVPVAGPPLERGTVTVRGDRIEAVDPHGSRRADLDLGDAAVLPGLVNAHTHLDLTGLRGQAPPSPDFTGWLRRVIAFRRGRTAEQVQADVRAGLDEALRFGTTLLGDISAGGASWEALASAPVRATVFRELIGLTAERAETAGREARDWLGGRVPSETCRPGLSPHAPYSVRAGLFEDSAACAVPLAVHLAETEAERALLEHRRGPFVAFLTDLGVYDSAGLIPSPEALLPVLTHAPRALLVHANYLRVNRPLPASLSAVYCPRTHAAFGHAPYPLRDFRTVGARVALGTDSLASNTDLYLLAEARLVHRLFPDVPAGDVVRMATLAGAEALGWGDVTGSLEVGKSADLVAVPLAGMSGNNPCAAVLESETPVRATLFRGQWRVT